MTTPSKTKKLRILSNIDFSGENAHIALTSKENGPANNTPQALILKSANYSTEYITKIQQVQVVMELPEFLERFFNVYGTQAEVLARLMGYEPPAVDDTKVFSYKDYIQEKIDSFTILKSVHEAKDQSEVLAKLNQEEYLQMITDQAKLEKSLKTLQDTSVANTQVTLQVKESDQTEVPAASDIVKSKTKKEKTMTDKTSVEMVEKSQLTELQKSLEDQRVALAKAQETIQAFEKVQKEQIIKAKTDKFSFIKDEKIRAPITKACLELESDEDFDAFLAAITSMATSVETSQGFIEKSALFQEQGASTSADTPVQESAVARILKAKVAVK